MTAAIHRLVEEQAAARGDAQAVIGPDGSLTYRDLNCRANAVARALMAAGFRRGGHALVVMDRSSELAVVLLGVLKAGGCYTWLEPSEADRRAPRGVSIATGRPGSEDGYVTVDLAPLVQDIHSSANLPVMMRPSDVAVVVNPPHDSKPVLIPHASVTSLLGRYVPRQVRWGSESGAMDLWLGLMTGATIRALDGIQTAA